MPIQLTSKSVVWPQNSDVCVVTRYAKGGATWPKTTIYSGICDLQEGAGDVAYNEAGAIISADAKCLIDVLPLPDIRDDDEMVFNGNAASTYTVISTSVWTMVPVHMELGLKRGVLPYRGKT